MPLQSLLSISLQREHQLPRAFLGQSSCVESYEKLHRIGEGTYGVVYAARDRRTKRLVALKKVRMDNESEGLPTTSLREIAILKSLDHENIVRVKEVVVGKELADFGLARKFEVPAKAMTPRVVTLWYRSPELLLGEKTYTSAIDIWSVGCIFGELIINTPLLPGKVEPHQMDLICKFLGTPNEQIWPGFTKLPLAHLFKLPHQNYSLLKTQLKGASPAALTLISDMLLYAPDRRITARVALRQAYFRSEGPNACHPSMIRMKLDSRSLGNDNTAGRERANNRRKFDGAQFEEERKRPRRVEDVDLALGAPPYSRFNFEDDRRAVGAEDDRDF
ncbi:Cyclin-dependent kinase 10 [Chytridiales sp. JEL 0842]|nr:Cyclin-dependent kinase 10 [Chytridiales sp. JEL 0842]